jgi:subtilisin family serine protease
MTFTGSASSLRVALALGAMTALVPAGTAGAADPIGTAEEQRYAPGQVLVRYEPGTSSSERAAVRDEAGVALERRLNVTRVELLDLDGGVSVPEALAELRADPDVAFAEPDYVYTLAEAIPDDTMFQTHLWGLRNTEQFDGIADADIDATDAWDVETGSPSVVVAVVDSGVSLTHPDMDDNIWQNEQEVLGSPTVDDDGNGKEDDANGWDFVDEDNDPTDEEGHGTHVAGTIGAEGNNAEGVTGVNWDVSLMALRACDRTGRCLNSNVADAFAYAGQEVTPGVPQARVVNASLSGDGLSASQQVAVSQSPHTLFVFAAGNSGSNNDFDPQGPCGLSGGNVVCVAASTPGDQLASFSNFGETSVDLAAPGTSIFSTYPLVDRATDDFEAPLNPSLWTTGGTPNTWARTGEASEIKGSSGDDTLTDSPGTDYPNGADSHATLGPVDLSADAGCYLRYDVELELAFGDMVLVEASDDDFATAPTVLHQLINDGVGTVAVDIPTLDGKAAASVRFRLVSDGGLTDDGLHLDNVKIRCPESRYQELQGTSMATPYVAGTAALLLTDAPSATPAELREWLLDGVDFKSSLDGRVATGGRLNAARSLSGANGTADIHPPQTSIVGGPPASSTSNSVSFSFIADEPATFACSLNSQAYSACASPLSLPGLAVGTHNFRVRATDIAGNQDATPATYAFTVTASTDAAACAALRQKLKRTKSAKKKRKLRKQIKRRCVRLGL